MPMYDCVPPEDFSLFPLLQSSLLGPFLTNVIRCFFQPHPSTPRKKKVRRKLAASLRGESGCPRQLPKNNDGVDANANASADGSTGARGASAAGQKQPSTLETSIADILAAGMLSEGGDATDAKAPDAPAVVEGKSQGLTTMRGEVTASGGFKGGDLERPVVLTGAMEMLATALIVLPVGDAKGAMQCVG